MQEINLKERLERLTERFAVYRARADVHPDLAWRIMLFLFGVGMFLVAGGGYLTYQWVMTEAVLPLSSGGGRTQISVKDIDALLVIYDAKRAAFEKLKTTAPSPPLLVRESKQVRAAPVSTTTSSVLP
jgi:hypothetical protein